MTTSLYFNINEIDCAEKYTMYIHTVPYKCLGVKQCLNHTCEIHWLSTCFIHFKICHNQLTN